ncbi:MAG: pilus (MSHA type) biogenesis protein MshL [Burkholderiales bacterium]|nr:pilus (MSHA type) biogenesis protein MshL [Burkholderiales bacterium]
MSFPLRLTGFVLALLMAGCAHMQPPQPPYWDASKAALDQAISATPSAQQASAEQALLPPIVVEMPQVDGRAVEPRFDLSVNNAPASEVFMAIVAGTRYSMIVHPSIQERISVNLKEVTVAEALDTVREMHGYEYKVQGMRILIQPITLQTRMFQVNYLLGQRKGRSEVRVSSGAISDSSGSTQTAAGSGTAQNSNVRALESSRIETRSDADFWNDLVAAVRTIIGAEEGRNVIVNPQSGLVVVRAMPAELRMVGDFLQAMENVVARQVMLEAKIIEVRLNDSFATGINWAAFYSNSNARLAAGMISPGTTLSPQGRIGTFTARGADGQLLANSDINSNPGAPGDLISRIGVPGTLFGLAFQTEDFAALLGFLETQGELQVLSSPRIATLNNQKAVLKVGTDEFFVTNITTNQTTTTGGAVQNSPSITVQPFFSGIALDVTPQIDANSQIILHVHPSVSQVIDKTKDIDLGDAGVFRLPLASSDIRETDTIVRVGDGNIVAIGGLMGEVSARGKSGLPWAGDLPVVGHAFKNTNRRTQKTELVILLKPTIIQSNETWKQDLRDVRQRLDGYQYTPAPGMERAGKARKTGS